MKKISVVPLIEYGSETGLEFLFELKRLKIDISSIICVGHEYSSKRKKLLEERTDGIFKRRSFTHFFNDLIIPIHIIENVNSLKCENLLNILNPDLVVFEGSFIIKNEIYKIPKYGMLNVHLAILPYLRGCSCMEWSILNNYPLGATCHYIAKNVDSGKIINRYSLSYNKSDSYGLLRTKLLYLAAHSMGQAVNNIINNNFRENNAHHHDKGPWYSPMKDLKTIEKMKNKIKLGDYSPIIINDNLPLEIVDIDVNTGLVI